MTISLSCFSSTAAFAEEVLADMAVYGEPQITGETDLSMKVSSGDLEVGAMSNRLGHCDSDITCTPKDHPLFLKLLSSS